VDRRAEKQGRVIISPDDLNAQLRTFIVAPLASSEHSAPFRVRCRFARKDGPFMVDRLRAVDRERLVKPLGVLPEATLVEVLDVLKAMFAV
jgi:mRNA interferase MazF